MHVEDDIVSDEQDDMDDDDLMTNGDGSPLTIDENSESGDRIIYPWMKKIHVAGVGEYDVPSCQFFRERKLYHKLCNY